MNQIKAFISYSSQDKQVAGKLKLLLQSYCGYEIFVAHDDLAGGAIFAEEIVKYINDCDFFIPLLSQNFKESQFTDQETGIAVGLGKDIIPIKLEALNPYGFISKYHAIQHKSSVLKYPSTDTDNMKEIAITIGKIGLSYSKEEVYKKAKNSIVQAFCASTDFYHTIAAMQIIGNCSNFTNEEISRLITALTKNRCVYDAIGISTFKQFLRNTYKVKLD